MTRKRRDMDARDLSRDAERALLSQAQQADTVPA